MNRILMILFAASTALVACKKDDVNLAAPSNISAVSAEPRVGGALIKWEVPSDSNFLYLEVRYMKKEQVVTERVSKYTDSLLVEGLLNKLDYAFEVQSFNASSDGEVAGEILTTNLVKPIRRPIQTKYYPDDLTKIEGITEDMLGTYTQETSEGPKKNLIDGDKNTYWHSAWSANVAPLPHWITLAFQEETTMGAISYFFRQSPDESGRPNQFALETSDDGETWEREWTSKEGLSVSPMADEKTLDFDGNFTAKHFRLLILKTPGMGTFTHLGDISFYSMKELLTDMEELAEEEY